MRTAPTEAVCALGVSLCVHAMGRLAARGNGSLELDPQTCCQVWKTLLSHLATQSVDQYHLGVYEQ